MLDEAGQERKYGGKIEMLIYLYRNFIQDTSSVVEKQAVPQNSGMFHLSQYLRCGAQAGGSLSQPLPHT
jgi:hypothetical protein